jgi:hypothetical protein
MNPTDANELHAIFMELGLSPRGAAIAALGRGADPSEVTRLAEGRMPAAPAAPARRFEALWKDIEALEEGQQQVRAQIARERGHVARERARAATPAPKPEALEVQLREAFAGLGMSPTAAAAAARGRR